MAAERRILRHSPAGFADGGRGYRPRSEALEATKGRKESSLRVCGGKAALRRPEVRFWPLERCGATKLLFEAPERAVICPMSQQKWGTRHRPHQAVCSDVPCFYVSVVD